MEDKKLESEYDNVFDGDEKVLNLLKLNSDAFTRRVDIIKVSDIGLSEPTKKGRLETKIGLTKTIKELGVVSPIHVMTTEMTDMDDSEIEDLGLPKYILLEGLRRLYGARKNKIDEIEAVVWDFKDKALGRKLSLVLSLIINKAQRRTWQETWELLQILELQSDTVITPGTLDYLLDVDAGDSMKLKDVMLSNDVEVIDELLANRKTLQQAYSLLQKHRKEENKLEKDDSTSISDVEGVENIISDEHKDSLTDEEVSELLELGNTIDSEITDENFGDANTSLLGDERQKVGERHIVDKAVKDGTFARDGFKCICCGIGAPAFLGSLVYHHKIPVHCGGPDTVENGATICDTDHIMVHIVERSGGKLPITKEQYEAYDEQTKKRISVILKLGRLAIEAAKVKGHSKEQIIKDAQASITHRMPGTDLKSTTQAYEKYKES